MPKRRLGEVHHGKTSQGRNRRVINLKARLHVERTGNRYTGWACIDSPRFKSKYVSGTRSRCGMATGNSPSSALSSAMSKLAGRMTADKRDRRN